MRRVFSIILLSFALTATSAQDIALSQDNDFLEAMRAVVSQGNLFYDRSNKAGIKQMADSLQDCLSVRGRHGMLSEMDSLELYADWHKLMGSFFYENGYENSSSNTKAENHYLKALSIYHNTPGLQGNLNGETMLHRELAQLYYREERYQEALNQISLVCDTYSEVALPHQEIEEDDEEYLDILSQQAICMSRVGRFSEAIKLMDNILGRYVDKKGCYGESLRKKAKILMLQEESGGKRGSDEALGLYKEYFQLKKADALAHFMDLSSSERERYWMRIRPFVTDCYRLEGTDAGFLYDVTLFAKGLLLQLDSTGGGRQEIRANWQMIQDRLKPDACAIEFVQYEKYGRQQMGALVLKKTKLPVFVKLADPDSVMQFVIDGESVENRIHHVEGALAHNRARRNAVYKDSTELFIRVWTQQLLMAVGDAHDIWFSPDGYMHRLAIEYMLPREAKGIVCHRLTSTRRLLETPRALAHSKAMIVGGIAYNTKVEARGYGNDRQAYSYTVSHMSNGFDYLEQSLGAVQTIYSIRENSQDTLLSDNHATELTFRDLCKAYPIIHVSSHGVFTSAATPQGTDLKPNLCDSTLSQSFIALAGVNRNLSDSHFNPSLQDGILSAKEIASLDMSQTELAVLCCCETGLGYITADGVYGLQRGLKNAGVGAIICSLWDIYEGSSNLFMDVLHYHITQGLPLSSAFEKARVAMTDLEEGNTIETAGSYIREISQHLDDNYDEPNYRNAFILIDALE